MDQVSISLHSLNNFSCESSVPDLSDLKEALHHSRTLLVRPPGAITGDVRGDASRNIWKPLEALRRSSLKALDHRLTAKYAEEVLNGVVETLEFGVKEVINLHSGPENILTFL
jgi:hypothetical protein